jgi:hypothetical protein
VTVSEKSPSFRDRLLAHWRPQPAIPAVLVLLLTLMMAMSTARSGQTSVLMLWLIPAGVLASCGLAVAAGFCSFFPQSVWILLVVLQGQVLRAVPGNQWNDLAMKTGIALAVGGLVLQAWRVRTGKFVPTIAPGT